MGELFALIVLPIIFGVAGISVMMIYEFFLYNFARKAGYTFEPGRFNFFRVLRPHVLRGSDQGHTVILTYNLGKFLSEGSNSPIIRLEYYLPSHRKIHMSITPGFPWEKRATPSGDKRFDRWVRVKGGPKAFIKELVSDATIRARLKETISPTFKFKGNLKLTPAGPLVLSRNSSILTINLINDDIELLRDIARIIKKYSYEEAD